MSGGRDFDAEWEARELDHLLDKEWETDRQALLWAVGGCVVCFVMILAYAGVWAATGVYDVYALLVLALPTNAFVLAVLYFRWKLAQ